MTDFRDQLRVEGLNVRGYGILPKMVMLDRKLTIEAKAIYGYFVSYAGAGNQAFPSVQKILDDLGISKTRYYNHFKLLKDYGYIKVNQIRNNNGVFKHNIYTLVTNPVPQNKKDKKTVDNLKENITKPSAQNNDTGKNELNTGSEPCPCFRESGKRESGNVDTNNNNLYISNNSLYNHHSFYGNKEKERKKGSIENEFQEILRQAQVSENVLNEYYKPVTRALETLYFREKPLEINNIVISTDRIKEDLKALNFFHIEMALNIFEEQAGEQIIHNKIAYLATCIYNCIHDIELKTKNDLKYNGII